MVKKQYVEDPDAPLNAKRKAFVREYLIDCNGTAAAIRAGYSAKTANEQAAQLLAKLSVQKALKAAQADVAEAAGITAVMVALEYKRMAFSDLADFVEWGPTGVTLKASATVPDTRAVLEVSESITEGGRTRKIKLHDKKGSLDSLCKQLGFNSPEKKEHTGKDGSPIQIEVSDAKSRLAERLSRAQQKRDPREPG